jgi:transposase-like protein
MAEFLHIDETYIKVAGRWIYLYRTIKGGEEFLARNSFLVRLVRHGGRPRRLDGAIACRIPEHPELDNAS